MSRVMFNDEDEDDAGNITDYSEQGKGVKTFAQQIRDGDITPEELGFESNKEPCGVCGEPVDVDRVKHTGVRFACVNDHAYWIPVPESKANRIEDHLVNENVD